MIAGNKSNCYLISLKARSEKELYLHLLFCETFLFFIEGVYGVSNSPISKPFQNIRRGKEQFSQIVKEYGSVQQKTELTEKLLSFMADQNR